MVNRFDKTPKTQKNLERFTFGIFFCAKSLQKNV